MDYLKDKPELSSLVRSLAHHTVLEEGDRVMTPVARGKNIPPGTLGVVTEVWGNPPIAYEVDFDAAALSEGIKREYLLLVAKASPYLPSPDQPQLRGAAISTAIPPAPEKVLELAQHYGKHAASDSKIDIERAPKLAKT